MYLPIRRHNSSLNKFSTHRNNLIKYVKTLTGKLLSKRKQKWSKNRCRREKPKINKWGSTRRRESHNYPKVPKKKSKITKEIKDKSEIENNGVINQVSESSCSDTSEDYTGINNRERNTNAKKKTTNKNRNPEIHKLSSSSISDSYTVTNFTNKDKKNPKKTSYKVQRKTQKRKKGEGDAENSDDIIGTSNYSLYSSSSAYTLFLKNDRNSDSLSSGDLMLFVLGRNFKNPVSIK